MWGMCIFDLGPGIFDPIVEGEKDEIVWQLPVFEFELCWPRNIIVPIFPCKMFAHDDEEFFFGVLEGFLAADARIINDHLGYIVM